MAEGTFDKTYQKLKMIRERTDLSLRPTPHLKETFTGFDGVENPLKLRYYQVQGILHLVAMNRFLLGDDCGLGKTLQSIAALCYLWEKKPDQKVIVLTNKSAVEQWASEFTKFTSNVRVIVCKGPPAKRRKAYGYFETYSGDEPMVMVMGYRSAVGDFAQLQALEDYILITDEATAYKNPSTQVHQVCAHMSRKATRTWALTATLIKNNLIEGFGIYKVLVPDLFGSKHRFMMEYCITRMQRLAGSRRQIPVIVGYRRGDIEHFKSQIDPYFIGRPKFEVASELPALTVREIKLGMKADQASKYQDALSGLLEIGTGDKAEEKETTKLTALIYCQQIVNHLALLDLTCKDPPKLESLIDLLKDGDLAGEKTIVFTRFKKLVNLLVPVFEKAGIGCVRITGDENEGQRKAAQKAFQDHNSDTQVVLITMAGGEAINLQSAKAIVFYDSPWSAGDYIQILGRMIRIGSVHDNVYAFHLITEGTVDQRVMQVLRKKMKLINLVLGKRIKGDDDEEDNLEVMVDNDISEIFSQLQADARNQ